MEISTFDCWFKMEISILRECNILYFCRVIGTMRILEIITAIVAIGGMVWIIKLLLGIQKSVGSHDEAIGNLRDKQKELKCDEHKKSIERHERDLTAFTDIKNSIRAIEEYLMGFDKDAYSQLLRKCSPYKLLFLGEQLLEKSGGRKCVDENLDMLLTEIEKRNPSAPLDVEESALNVVRALRDTPLFNDVKNFVYYSPQQVELIDENGEKVERGVHINIIFMLMSIYLRDKFFERHPEMDTSDFLKS